MQNILFILEKVLYGIFWVSSYFAFALLCAGFCGIGETSRDTY